MHVSRTNLIPLIVACAFFMQQVNSTIVATALPQMAADFGTTAVHMSSALTAYILAVAIFIPLSGWMADRYGGSLVFRAAIIVFTTSAVLCGLAQTPTELFAARVLQGMGGAMMVPVGRMVVLRSTPKSDYVKAMALMAVPSLIGPVLGAPIGGFITTYASWRWIFLYNVPFGLVGLALATIYIENVREETRRPLDWAGFLLSGIAVGCLMFGVEAFGRGTASAWTIVACVVMGVSVGVIAVRHLRRAPFPIMDLSLLKIATFRTPNLGSLWFRMSSQSLPFLLPLLFQIGFGMSAFGSGLLTFASSLGALTMRSTAKPILRRFGFRNVLVSTAMISSATMACCALFTESTPWLVVVLWLLVVGFFRALGNSSCTTLAVADVSDEKMGSAVSFTQLMNQLGNAMAVAVAAIVLHGSVVLRGASEPLALDFKISLAVMSAMALLSLPAMLMLPRDAGSAVSGYRDKKEASASAP